MSSQINWFDVFHESNSSYAEKQKEFELMTKKADQALADALIAESRSKEANKRAEALLEKLDKQKNRCRCCGKH